MRNDITNAQLTTALADVVYQEYGPRSMMCLLFNTPLVEGEESDGAPTVPLDLVRNVFRLTHEWGWDTLEENDLFFGLRQLSTEYWNSLENRV